MLVTIITIVIVLAVLILVHELGHYWAAKRSGVRVEEFGIGFPPRIVSFKKGETRYSLNIIPLGGFVRLTGEDGTVNKKDSKNFLNKRVRTRAKILVAGILMNLLLAAVLISISSAVGLPTAVSDDVRESSRIKNPQVQIVSVSENSPAKEVGMETGDVVASINDKPTPRVEDVVTILAEYQAEEEPVEVVLERGDETIVMTAVPRSDPPPGEGALGVELVRTALVSSPWYLVPWEGVKLTVLTTGRIIAAFAILLKNLVVTGELEEGIAGPVGIAVLTGKFYNLGFVYLMQFVAILSINLAIINIIPIPAVDGGRLLFLAIEKIRNKPVSRKVEGVIHSVGFALVILLMIVITFRDFVQFEVFDRIRNLF